jgi:hypothetical protein
MGRIIHEVKLHRHEEPPPPEQYGLGTVWECSCGSQRKLENDQRDGGPCWVWVYKEGRPYA